jgi:tRNA-dihydrouridine synthase
MLQAGQIAEEEGAAGVTLHARTAEQLYSPPADWEAIRQLAAELRIPVIGNGDVFEGADAIRMIRETGEVGAVCVCVCVCVCARARAHVRLYEPASLHACE